MAAYTTPNAYSTHLAETYSPRKVEPRIYKFWLEIGVFAPAASGDALSKQSLTQTLTSTPFTIALPPPNITGELHIGHALCYLAQDIAGRRARMMGRPTLLLPGMDHAGIATQNVVERQLASEGLVRADLGRKRFEERCWAFVNATMPVIRSQFQRLGFSFDWSRERFTLDQAYQRAVDSAFVHFFRKGWVYRGHRLVNWCPRCSTSVSDLEVEYVNRQAALFTIEYLLEGEEAESLSLPIATTRPETMLGDTAVAVHPDDSRYTHYAGRTAILPLLGRRLPIIADRAVDPNFGTGALKVTPAHDVADYELSERHALQRISVIGEDGRMTDASGPYVGLTAAECRDAVVSELTLRGLLLRQQPYVHSVGTCERCHTVIEPLISRQWFLKMRDLAGPALDAVRSGRVRIEPSRWERVYLHWMENIRDWCISRQLWWGHRLPVWTCQECGTFDVYSHDTVRPETCDACGCGHLEQEPDVLDTWFSSALWPFASLGWPEDTYDLARFYPGDLLGTAGEIIFLWVARMIMEGLEFMGTEPFKRVYINPIVLAEDGRRMSKSLGTGVDPMIACDAFGADAIRWALVRDNTLAQTVRFTDSRADEGRCFGNKVWNASRFVLNNLDSPDWAKDRNPVEPSLPDRWIVSRLNACIAACDQAYDELRFDLAARAIYDFFWGDFCDWYLEIAKSRLERPATRLTLGHCLDSSLRLLHPLMPFVTEEIWSHFDGPMPRLALIVSQWPTAGSRTPADEEEMQYLQALVRGIRNARARLGTPPGKRIPAIIAADGHAQALLDNMDWLARLAKLDQNSLAVHNSVDVDVDLLPSSATVSSGPFACFLSLDASRVHSGLDHKAKALTKRITDSERLLAGEFGRRAPKHVVERERQKLAELRQKRHEIEQRMTQS